ncbi:unnamed protein product [Menidia menidia]|uniref:(Atlantic silverside) hypothetical protein n=1 Tax=Menidia menidia TaxID=238744 RepID=A0A8S4BA52_9TELE|nr:unnamed protein product [Menidia menidia]
MSAGGGFRWTVVVLTCQHKDSVYAFQRELELRQQRGTLSEGALVLTVRDRQEPLGSGGATLNALLVAAEHLSSRAGHTVVTADVLDQAHILILHTGRDFPWSSCSRAFCWLPREEPGQRVQAPLCCLDLLLDRLSAQICPGSPPGVWVCSTDMVLCVPPDFSLSWEGFSGVRVLGVPGEASYAADHGVYLSDAQGRVLDIVYRGTREQIQRAAMPDGKVPLVRPVSPPRPVQVSGPVFFSRQVSEKLLQTHVSPPLDGCTYLGLDSGAPPLQISLFLDLLKCLCSDLTKDQFVGEERAGCSSPAGPQGAAVRSGRAELWRILRGAPLTLVYVPGGRYDYLTASGRQQVERLTRDWPARDTLSHIQAQDAVSAGSRVINSVLEGRVGVASGAVVQHCHLQGPLDVPSGCLLSGLDASAWPCVRRLALSSDIIIQGHRLLLGQLKLNVYTAMGAHDDLQASDGGASFLNQNWSIFHSRTGIQPEDLWARGEPRSLLEARLFPVLHPRGGAVGLEGGVGWLLGGAGCLQSWREAWRLSLREVLSLTHQEAELLWREELQFLAGRRRVADALRGRSDACLLPCFRAVVLGGQQEALLETLDSIAAGGGEEGAEPESGAEPGDELGVAARCLSCIADVLVIMAAGKGGLRSGPAANEAWSPAYLLLEGGDLGAGVQALAAQRQLPDLLVRAARHYEGAGQVLLRRAVMSSQRFISIGPGEAPPFGEWQEVHCPARLDLAGGWSDTPPIAFEHGGSVTNIAVKVDGRRPIGARARRIREPRLLLVSHAAGRHSAASTETACDSLGDLKDCSQPHAPGRGWRPWGSGFGFGVGIGFWVGVWVGFWVGVRVGVRVWGWGLGRVRVGVRFWIWVRGRGSVSGLGLGSGSVFGVRFGVGVGVLGLGRIQVRVRGRGSGPGSLRCVCAAGALLKAVCVCSGLVSLTSQEPLGQQLLQRWGGGLELHSWSELPTGSGLGTSSILAGALLAAVFRCTGRTYDTDSLIHAVLHLEQILTTGGGWQDQVGGLVGGVKVGRSAASLPLRVEVERLRLPEDFQASLEQHLLLQLVSNSEECARACVAECSGPAAALTAVSSAGSLSRLGECLDRSWQQKKLMAPGCEPASVRAMMQALRPLVLGQSLAGAGGGGFLYLLTREPRQRDAVLQALRGTPGLGDFSVHSVELDVDGLTALPPDQQGGGGR